MKIGLREICGNYQTKKDQEAKSPNQMSKKDQSDNNMKRQSHPYPHLGLPGCTAQSWSAGVSLMRGDTSLQAEMRDVGGG